MDHRPKCQSQNYKIFRIKYTPKSRCDFGVGKKKDNPLKVDKLHIIEIKIFCMSKNTIKNEKDKPQSQRK